MAISDILATATSLFIKSTILAARWAGTSRHKALESIAAMSIPEKAKEIVFVRNRVEQLELQVQILRKNAGKKAKSPRYTIAERLHVIWFVEYFQIPRRRASDYLGIARSTLYRWVRRIDDAAPASVPRNRTPNQMAQLVWEIAKANLSWGRVRIANQLGLLDVFLAASTVRNILSRPKPPTAAGEGVHVADEPRPDSQHTIRAPYPNSTWSIDKTSVLRWGLWPVHIFVAVDHFSR
jgi:transposase